MTQNKFQIIETFINNFDGSAQKAWTVVNVTDSKDNFVVDTFTVKADAKHYANKWSKQNAN